MLTICVMLRIEQPLTAATADPNAATAAAAVFQRHESNASLSAAAAAAALRARPMTPTRVADVQTKRTLRRSASVASTGNSPELQGEPPLRRRGSSGSMTERTFRAASPHRPGSSGSGHRQSQSPSHDTPPVPALPKYIDTAFKPSGADIQVPHAWGSSSLGRGSTSLRLASQKLAAEGAPAWFSAAKLGNPANVRRTDPAMASPPSSPLQFSVHGDEPGNDARPSSQASSINFSYPTRTRVNSLPSLHIPEALTQAQTPAHASQPQPLADGSQTAPSLRTKQQSRGQATSPPSTMTPALTPSETLVYDPNSRRMVRQADLLPSRQVIQQAQQPMKGRRKKKKKKKGTPQRAGSHLAAGTVSRTKSEASRGSAEAKIHPVRAPLQVQPPDQVEAAPTSTADLLLLEEPAVKAIITSPRLEARKLEQHRAQEAANLAQLGPHTAPTAAADAARHAIRRLPSVVREEAEPEDQGSEETTHRAISDALDAVPARQRIHPGPDTESSPQTQSSHDSSAPASFPRYITDQASKHPPAPFHSVDKVEEETPKPSAVRPGQISRAHSNSPARQAHFGPVENNPIFKHSPPPRSISPRKSALKHTSPPRGASPSGDTSETSGSVNQEPLTRKKSVRVSFDDENTTVVGDSASQERSDLTLLASPQQANRQRLFSSLGRAKGDLASLEDDEVMKPRPVLPSFGSIRDKKPREASPAQGERPLVRPKVETRYTSPLLPSPPLGRSNDHAIGAFLSKEREDGIRHAANTSRLREPLPPVVTSVDGTGYESNSSSTSSLVSSVFEPPEASIPTATPRPVEPAESQTAESGKVANGAATNNDAERLAPATNENGVEKSQPPFISPSQPTPAAVENKSLGQYLLEIPGQFPADDSDQPAASAAKKLAAATTAAPSAAAPDMAPSASAAVREPPAADADAECSSDSESSIYSDAYEDLSEISGGGFQSLDAVVESPVQNNPIALPSQLSRETPVSKAREETPRLQADVSSATTAVETPLTESPHDEWERVKAYWKRLTAEQRAQLEREAREDADPESNLKEVKSEAKPKKKGVERRYSERKGVAANMAQQGMAQQEKEKASNPERSYMIKPGAQWSGDDRVVPPMRQTMRGAQHQAPAPAAEGPRLRKSMRSSSSRVSNPESQRPMSSPPAAAALPGAGHSRSAASQAEPVLGTARRQNSTGSESSFKRARPGSSNLRSSGFRQSLRPTSPSVPQASSKRFSLRALSPVAASKQDTNIDAVTMPTQPQMRMTLRDDPSEKDRPTGIRMPSFGLPYGGRKSRGSGAKARSSGGSRFSSRFADSSDEEEGVGITSSNFRSRFEDSSDEDGPLPPMPVSLPRSFSTGHVLRKQTSVASTALPEEVEESSAEGATNNTRPADRNVTQPQTARMTPVIENTSIHRSRSSRSGKGQILPPASQTAPAPGSATVSSTLSAPGAPGGSHVPTGKDADRPSKRDHSRRDSLIVSVLRRKSTKGIRGGGSGKIAKGEVSESAARRDTPLERSVGELRGLWKGRQQQQQQQAVNEAATEAGETEGEGDVPSPLPSPSRSPKLQKRVSVSARAHCSSSAAYDDAVAVAATSAGAGLAAAGGGGVALDRGYVGGDDEAGGFGRQSLLQLGRPVPSGNLGTRTLSGGNASQLYQPQLQQERALSMEGQPSMEGSVAGGSSVRRKRFKALRRMFGLDE